VVVGAAVTAKVTLTRVVATRVVAIHANIPLVGWTPAVRCGHWWPSTVWDLCLRRTKQMLGVAYNSPRAQREEDEEQRAEWLLE
jgi:hypothetical protein